jgi:hypothetical protein
MGLLRLCIVEVPVLRFLVKTGLSGLKVRGVVESGGERVGKMVAVLQLW